MLFDRITAFFSALLTLAGSFLGISSNTIKKEENFRVTTYIVGSYVQTEDSLHSEDFDIVTDVIVFGCATFDNEGNVNIEKDTLSVALKNIRNAIGDRDIRITLNILGPGGQTDSTVWEDQMDVQSEEHNKAFNSGVLEDNILAVLEEYDFDGVHFDYEYPLSLKAWRNFNKFIVSFDKKSGDYTIGIAASDWNLKFSTKALAAIDTIELMLYDMIDENGRHSTYEHTVKLAGKTGLHGIPLEKVNLGLPFYSRPTDLDAYWYDYRSFHSQIDADGWYHCEDTDKDFWFNTTEVIKNKTEYAINNGFGGVMMWHYTCDLPSTQDGSLLKAINTAVKNNY